MLKIILVSLLFTQVLYAEIKILAKSEVKGGSKIVITLEGKFNKGDYLTIVEKNTQESNIQKKEYINEAKLISYVPVKSGLYEIRYIDRKTKEILATSPLKVLNVSASIIVKKNKIQAGGIVYFDWKGPAYKTDFITLVPKNSEEGSYEKYIYVKDKTSGQLKMPDKAGEYEIRYLTGPSYKTIGKAFVTGTPTNAKLNVPDKIKAGEVFEITFQGPYNHQDFITIVPKNALERTYKKYVYVKSAKDGIVSLTAPDKAGEYEVRYLTGEKYYTLASSKIKVNSANAKVSTKKQAISGAKIKISFQGPENPKDFITIVKKGSADRKYGNYTYVKNGDKGILNLQTPEENGDFEIRYLTGEDYLTLATTEIKLISPTASIKAKLNVEARSILNVNWNGPNNPNDYISLAKVGSAVNEYIDYAYTKRGSVLKLKAPNTAGKYELRYLTGIKKNQLAKQEINVTPSKLPGRLLVSSNKTFSENSSQNKSIAIILDASGSMLKKENGVRRIDIAKSALEKFLTNDLDEKTEISLRVFGHKEADSCRTDLEIPLQKVNSESLKNKIKSIQAMNLAKTPIARSIELTENDLRKASGEKVVLLVTDGEETCNGNPEIAIKNLINSGVKTKINIVGFAIDELMLKETFRTWARIGKGAYFDARNSKELIQSMKAALEIPFEVFDYEGRFITHGIINGDEIELMPGNYKIVSESFKTKENIFISSEETAIVELEVN